MADGPGITVKVSQKTHDFKFGSNRVWNENNSRGGLLHRDMTPKKSALKLRELLSERWHTDLTLETDADGYISFRGFYGTYEAQAGDRVLTLGLHK